MATKTFKIGLSNTDKQNMAQDVYERLLALTFAEYDSSETYDTGDFVVYEDVLYQCKEDNVTGAWDSSKWEQATLQDLLDDIEDAVAFVNDKANVDGNYPTMTVGAADELTPYDENSGALQEQPFLFQGTGCGNGEQQVDTGSLALLKEKQGHSVVVNQFVPNNKINANIGNGSVIASGLSLTNHKFFIHYDSEGTLFVNFLDSNDVSLVQKTDKNAIAEVSGTTVKIVVYTASGEVPVTNFCIVDLTQWFGSNDNIPAHLLSHPEDFFRYYQGSLAYNEGTLVNSNGRYLKTFGRNQWDEVAELDTRLSSKNYISVIPNTDYYFYAESLSSDIECVRVAGYDKDKNFVDYIDMSNINASGWSRPNHSFTIPSNVVYIKFELSEAYYGTTYNHDITISLYYEDESGYDQYYPYEELANIDTGTETLRSAGSVKDSKAPDGTITRRVGYVDLGALSWSYDNSNSMWYSSTISTNIPKAPVDNGTVPNISCDKYIPTSNYNVRADRVSNSISLALDGTQIYVNNGSSTTEPSGMLFYELAEPTTEQGTPFSENVQIDDFGSMEFAAANGVPTGASLFYAVDYKAFIDTLYNYVDGTANNLLSKTMTQEQFDTALNAYGYFKVEDLSSTVRIINEGNTWTTNYKKLIKIGDLYTLNLCVQNASGQSLATSDIAEILSINVSENIYFSNCRVIRLSKIIQMLSDAILAVNEKLYVNISWVNK